MNLLNDYLITPLLYIIATVFYVFYYLLEHWIISLILIILSYILWYNRILLR